MDREITCQKDLFSLRFYLIQEIFKMIVEAFNSLPGGYKLLQLLFWKLVMWQYQQIIINIH